MIDVESISPLDLPSIALEDRAQLPSISCVYLAINSDGDVQYIGQTIDLKRRWIQHHRFGLLSKMKGARIAYLAASADSLLKIESELIQWFRPPLNKSGIESDRFNLVSDRHLSERCASEGSRVCPECKSDRVRLFGKREGKQRYRCLECGRSFVDNPVVPHGRPLIGSEPLTAAEKMKRYRQRKRDLTL